MKSPEDSFTVRRDENARTFERINYSTKYRGLLKNSVQAMEGICKKIRAHRFALDS